MTSFYQMWDMSAVLTVLLVMFTVVLSTVFSVTLVKSIILRQTKEEILDRVDKISRRIDAEADRRNNSKCK